MYHSMHISRVVTFSFSLLVLGLCWTPSSALAGFQWVAPSDGVTGGAAVIVPDAQMRATRPAPVLREQEIISPLVIEGTTPSNTQPLNMLSAPVVSAPAARTITAEAEQPTQLASTKTDSKEEKIVSGFANKVPLAVALRQILPSSYGFSVDQDVKLTSLVSWQGGKPWRDVMFDMLQTAGFDMREQDRMVRVVRSASAPKVEAEASYVPPVSTALAQKSLSEPKAKSFNEPLPVKNVPEHTLQLPSTYAATPVYGAVDTIPASSFVEPTRTVDTWTASRGDMLRKVIETWSRKANVEVNWMSEYDYPLQASVTMTGSFEEAVRNILAGFQEAQPQPVGVLHANPGAGQTVLVVEARGNYYSE